MPNKFFSRILQINDELILLKNLIFADLYLFLCLYIHIYYPYVNLIVKLTLIYYMSVLYGTDKLTYRRATLQLIVESTSVTKSQVYDRHR